MAFGAFNAHLASHAEAARPAAMDERDEPT
jgi:hypothetical protein